MHKKNSTNVLNRIEMRYYVNETCIGCGLCEATCPEVFSIQGDVAVAIDAEVPELALENAAEAKENCPVGAIEER